MKLFVAGATGRCGSALVSRAVARGHQVHALVRDVSRAEDMEQLRGAVFILGDPADADGVSKAVADCDVVLSCLASFTSPHTQMSKFSANVIAAAAAHGRPSLRYIVYGLCNVDADGAMADHMIQNLVWLLSPYKFRPAMKDHQRQIALLKESTLNYSIFQTVTMTSAEGGARQYIGGTPSEAPGVHLWQQLNVFDAADLVLDRLEATGQPVLQMRYA